MGGPGSTRWLHHRRKLLAEDSLRLDVERIATRAARDPSQSSGILVWPSGGDLPHATARYQVGENYRGRYLGLELANARPHQAGLHTQTLWLTELRTFRHSRRILALCPGCEGRMAKAYWPSGKWTAGFCCRRCTGITDASNQREDKRVNEFRRRPDLALQEIENHGPRARLALDSLPSWFTGLESHPGGRHLQRDFSQCLVDGWLVEGSGLQKGKAVRADALPTRATITTGEIAP